MNLESQLELQANCTLHGEGTESVAQCLEFPTNDIAVSYDFHIQSVTEKMIEI